MRTGYRLAIGVASLTAAIAVALAVVELLSAGRDPTAYGTVPVPGRDSVSMPAGDVIVFYGEPGASGDRPLVIPRSLKLFVRTTRGQLLAATPYAFDQFTDGDYVRRSIGKLRVPEAGAYEAVASAVPSGAAGAEITFGRNGSRDFAYVAFVLAGGLLLAAILGFGTFLVERRERAG
jgi:hypothetical protein